MALGIWMLKDNLEKTDFLCVCPMSWLEFRAGMCLILLRLQKSVFQKKINLGILMGVGVFWVFWWALLHPNQAPYSNS